MVKRLSDCIIIIAVFTAILAATPIFDEDIQCDQNWFKRYDYWIDNSIQTIDRTCG